MKALFSFLIFLSPLFLFAGLDSVQVSQSKMDSLKRKCFGGTYSCQGHDDKLTVRTFWISTESGGFALAKIMKSKPVEYVGPYAVKSGGVNTVEYRRSTNQKETFNCHTGILNYSGFKYTCE